MLGCEKIEQILINLCANAFDALPDGGEIEVATANVSHEEMKGKEYNPRSGKYVLLTVRDNGIGMDQNTLRRVFEPFFCTNIGKGGTGLGLSITYGLVQELDGEITVKSDAGQGATFEVILPITPAKIAVDTSTTDTCVESIA